jgi:hypothetical protein
MADKDKFAGLPHVRVEDFSDRDFLRIQEDRQRAEAHEHNVETGSYEREVDDRGSDVIDQEKLQKAAARVLDKTDDDVEDHAQVNLGVEEAVQESADSTPDEDERVDGGPANDSPKTNDGAVDAGQGDPVANEDPKPRRAPKRSAGQDPEAKTDKALADERKTK